MIDDIAPMTGGSPFAGSMFLAESAAVARRATAPDHLDTLSARNDVGVAALWADRPLDAARELEQLVLDCRTTLGAGHPESLIVEGNLAVGYVLSGRLDDGLALMERNMRARETHLGVEHPRTVDSRNAVATTRRLAGRPDDACRLHEQVVVSRTVILGELHRDTLVARLGWALALAEAGKAEGAVTVLEQALKDVRPSAGEPMLSLAIRRELGLLLARCGRITESIVTLRVVLAEHENVLGESDSETAEIRRMLAAVERQSSRPT